MVPRRRQRTSPLAALMVVLLCVLVLAAAIFRTALASALWRGLSPVIAWRDGFGSTNTAQLRAQLASTTAALADRDHLAAENAQLRAQLGRNDAHGQIVAGVLVRPPGTPYDTLVVDAGRVEGVAPGDRVVAGALGIGVVDEVYADSSRVVLYSAPGQSYDALLEASSTAVVPLVVEGQGAGSLSARVPAGTQVHTGDRVAFPGLNGALAGAVVAVSGTDTDTFKTIYLRLPIDPFALQFVYIQK